MSIWALAFPAEAAVPVVEAIALTVVRASRPLLGVGLGAGVLLLFKPLLIGLLQAALLMVRPRRTREQRSARQKLSDMLLLGRLARQCAESHPNQAAELLALAARD